MNFNEMEVIRDLTTGKSGEVRLLRDRRNGNTFVVRLQTRPGGNESKFASKFMETVLVLSSCSHPCLLGFVGWSFPRESHPGQIGCEYAEGGSLRSHLTGGKLVDDTLIAIITCGLVRGMKYLHSRGIVHRNLCPDTIFIDSSLHPKIGGLEALSLWSSEFALDQRIESSYYTAPELYRWAVGSDQDQDPDQCQDKEYAQLADVYSFGLILYEMIIGRPVFGSNIGHEQLILMASGTDRPELPRTLNCGVRRMIRQCWSADVELRNSFDVIWRQLENLNFQITPRVDCERVCNYIREIK
jgi:serine/threonine-protein kinase